MVRYIKMDKIKICFLLSIIILLLNNCTEKTRAIHKSKQDELLNGTKPKFGEFIKKFETLSFPFKGELESRNFRKFYNFSDTDQKAISKVKIPNDVAKKYFFAGRDSLISKTEGGIFEFFYGYKLPSNGNYYLLFYNRNSSSTSFEYRLASFSLDGSLIDDIGIGGGIDTGGSMDLDIQREFLINEDYTIDIEEVTIVNPIVIIKDTFDNYLYKVNRKDFVYTIKDNGVFEIKSEKKIGELQYYTDNKKAKYVSNSSNSMFRY
jgi:hypothetical protein